MRVVPQRDSIVLSCGAVLLSTGLLVQEKCDGFGLKKTTTTTAKAKTIQTFSVEFTRHCQFYKLNSILKQYDYSTQTEDTV